MKCLMELDSRKYGLSQKEKLAYLGYKFAQMSAGVECPVTHIFEEGTYVREMRIPPEVLFVGRVHLLGHRVELVSGNVLLITEEFRLHVDAPTEMETQPGAITCFYSKTPVIGRTYHPNPDECRDIPELEDRIFGPISELLDLGREVAEKISRIDVISDTQLIESALSGHSVEA